MQCKEKREVVRVFNTMLLSSGGYSFGYLLSNELHMKAKITAFMGAGIFFAFSFLTHRVCKIGDR